MASDVHIDVGAPVRNHRVTLALLAGLTVGLALPADADTLYSNGPVNGAVNGWDIGPYFGVANSFDIAASSNVTGITFYTWNLSGDAPSTVDWSITTTPDFADSTTSLASGTASLANSTLANPSTFLFATQYTDGNSYDIYSSQFSIAPLSLGVGMYWLQLTNATDTAGVDLFWDENDGPSQAWDSDPNLGYPNGGYIALGAGACVSPGATGYCSESFQITGDLSASPSPVPEPGSLTLLTIGLLGLAGMLRRPLAR